MKFYSKIKLECILVLVCFFFIDSIYSQRKIERLAINKVYLCNCKIDTFEQFMGDLMHKDIFSYANYGDGMRILCAIDSKSPLWGTKYYLHLVEDGKRLKIGLFFVEEKGKKLKDVLYYQNYFENILSKFKKKCSPR